MSDIKFIDGLIVKAPNAKAPEYVKCALSINVPKMKSWLVQQTGEWVNADVKESRDGKWYAAINEWKPTAHAPKTAKASSKPTATDEQFDDDIPF